MLCPNCRADNPQGTRSCSSCGSVLAGTESTGTVQMEVSGGAPSAIPANRMQAAGVLSPPPDDTVQMSMAAATARARYADPIHLEPGTPLGPRYRIEALLGEGGMGAVYKAHDNELGRTVALKLVRPELARNPSIIERFKRELLLASRISHKNILRIHDLGDVNGVKFITMAYVEGRDLAAIQESGRMPLSRALEIARQLSAALEAAHNEGVVHRDLKPQNILVDEAGVIYVSDFGLAKSIEAEEVAMTRPGQVLGTPRYMSPEQVEAKAADHRSDLYSFGLILYELVTGAIPFPGASALQMMYQRVIEQPKNPRLINPEVPDYVASIILRCLEKDPARRYQHAREILADLDAGRAPARTISIQLPKPDRRWWKPGAVAVLVITLAGAGGYWLRHSAVPGSSTTGGAAPTASAQAYLAVLPLALEGNGQALSYAADGIREALSAKLSGLHNVYVASSSAVDSARNLKGAERIARALGVSLLVSGTFRAEGDRIAVSLAMDDIRNRKQLWKQEFSGLTQDLLTIEDEMYSKLVVALNVERNNDEMARGAMRPTEDMGAYELYLRSRSILRGPKTAKSITSAISLFNRATQKDPSFALAYAGLADASLDMQKLTSDSFWAERALGAANQAERLNENLPEAHLAQGSAYLATGKTAEAVAELRRALELEPNSDEALRRLANALLAARRQPEAIRAFQDAIRVNPYYWMNYNELGAAYFQMGENEKAVETFRRVTALEPERASGYLNLGVVYYRQGKWNESAPQFRKAIELQPSPRAYSNLGVVYFYLGRYQDAAQMFDEAAKMNPNDYLVIGNLADSYRWLKDRAQAADAYQRAIGLAYKAYAVNPRNAALMGSLALYYAKSGQMTRARDFIRRARTIKPDDGGLRYNQAVIEAMDGQAPQALESLRGALEKGYPMQEAMRDPELEALRADAKFRQIVQVTRAGK